MIKISKNTEICLDLREHCIQTAIKKSYNQQISKYFKLGPTENPEPLESGIALLKSALETLDFSALRTRYPELQGGGTDKIMIAADTHHSINLSINGRKIHAIYKNHKLPSPLSP